MKNKQDPVFGWRETVVSLAVPGVLCLILPALVYSRNVGAVPFALADTWQYLAGAYAALVCLLAGLLVLSRALSLRHAAVGVVTVAFCIWVQGTFILYDLGSLDGHPVDWAMFRNGHLVEAGVWLGALTFGYLLRRRLYESLGWVMLGFIVVAGFPLLGGLKKETSHVSTVQYFDDRGEFAMSSERNIIVIVLDTARMDAFEQVMQRRPDIERAFRGFTAFQNTTAGFSITKPSIPLILSGVFYENNRPFPKYMQEVAPRSLPARLRGAGFRTEYYSHAPFAFLDQWDNATTQPSRSEVKSAFRKLVNVTILRYAPLFLKPRAVEAYYKSSAFWGKDMVEFAGALESVTATHSRPVFKFIHLTGAHPPFLLNRSLERTENGEYLDQLEGALGAVAGFMEQLRRRDLFSNSAIFVLGDHGSTETWSVPDALQKNSTMAMLNGMPMLLAKGFGPGDGPLRTDQKPVSLADISSSVLDVVGGRTPEEGISIFGAVPADRKRQFYFYNHWEQVWSAPYLPTLYRSEVQGPVRERDSWRITGRRLESEGRTGEFSLKYRYGTNLVASEQLFVELCSFGFREEHGPGAWAMGPVSKFYLSVEATDEPLSLVYDAAPFLAPPLLSVQRARLTVNGRELSNLVLAEGNVRGTIPLGDSSALTAHGEIELAIEFPDAVYSPRDLGRSNDFRDYAAFFRQLSIERRVTYSLPYRIFFQAGKGAEHFCGRGWSTAERDFTWTSSESAEFRFDGDEALEKPLQIKIAAFPFLGNGRIAVQDVRVLSDAKEVGRMVVGRDDVYTIRLPGKPGRRSVVLDVRPSSPLSPASVGVGGDRRQLGIAVRWLQIETAER